MTRRTRRASLPPRLRRPRLRPGSPAEAKGLSLEAKLARCRDLLSELFDDAMAGGLPAETAHDLIAPHKDLFNAITLAHALKRKRGAATGGARSEGPA
ncbi:MAG: hypothetical protein OXC15_04810 [Rhodospirillaceae bacterium]|nr:hypothetical protein [Rhodospirillaceae bacterium]